MLSWIADYRVLATLDDPAAPGARWLVAPPARLGADPGAVVVEAVAADPADLLPDLARWAAASGAGGLAVPLEVGPWDGRDGWAWVSRHVGAPEPRPLAAGAGPSALAALAATAGGLAALHGAGAVHGAIGAPRVLADGASGSLDLPGAPGPVGRLVVAQTPEALDTVAPELLRGEPPSAPADVWALAATALLVLAGRPVHPGLAGDVLLEGVARVLAAAPDLGDVDDRLAAALGPCLRTDPDERAPAGALADELGRLAAGDRR